MIGRASVLALISGCSALAVGRVPDTLPAGPVACTSDVTLAVLDGAAAVAAGAVTATFALGASQCFGEEDDTGACGIVVLGIVPFLTTAVLFAVSGSQGLHRVHDWREVNRPERIAARRQTPAIERALQLVEQGLAAAQAGDCASVRKLGASIRIASQSVHDDVFAKQPTVARCLDLTSHCFDEVIPNGTTHFCFLSADECEVARSLVPGVAASCHRR